MIQSNIHTALTQRRLIKQWEQKPNCTSEKNFLRSRTIFRPSVSAKLRQGY
uniref:Uncharacterized protein n=1 Tax=Anguilla anguilla TaxID=7936 RepID=A0A0E9UKN7_ANGAN